MPVVKKSSVKLDLPVRKDKVDAVKLRCFKDSLKRHDKTLSEEEKEFLKTEIKKLE